jgi:hypothetical protein
LPAGIAKEHFGMTLPEILQASEERRLPEAPELEFDDCGTVEIKFSSPELAAIARIEGNTAEDIAMGSILDYLNCDITYVSAVTGEPVLLESQISSTERRRANLRLERRKSAGP